MIDVKNILQSKTIWGGVIALTASLLGIWGYSIGIEDQATIVDLIASVGGVIGSVVAIYGRVVATKKIG